MRKTKDQRHLFTYRDLKIVEAIDGNAWFWFNLIEDEGANDLYSAGETFGL